jgi:hypothetical protein
MLSFSLHPGGWFRAYGYLLSANLQAAMFFDVLVTLSLRLGDQFHNNSYTFQLGRDSGYMSKPQALKRHLRLLPVADSAGRKNTFHFSLPIPL